MMSKEEQLLHREKGKALLRGKLEDAAAICNQLGDIKSRKLNYEDALAEHEEELQLSKRLGKLESVAVAHRRVGETLVKLGRYQEAVDHHQLYQEMAENCGDPVEIQRAWATVGWTNFNYYSAIIDDEIEDPCVNTEKLLSHAQFAFSKSLDCAEKLKDQITAKEYNEMKARLLLNVALIFDQRNKVQECSTSLRKAIHLCKSNNLIEDLHRCQYSLASIYFSHGAIDPANSAIDQATNNARTLKNVTYVTDSLLLKSKLQISKKDYASGKRYAKKAFKLCLPASKDLVGTFLRNVVGLCRLLQKLKAEQSLESRCDMHEQVADVCCLLSCFSLATEHYQSALSLAKELNKPSSNIASIYFSLAKTCADSHDYPKAIEYWQQEISCNKGNPKEICSTLLEIAKVKEKQCCDQSSICETLNSALQAARDAGSAFLEYSCLEKLINFEKRQEKTTREELLARLNDLQKQQGTEENCDETSNSTLDVFLNGIDLNTISDFSDSDDDDDAVGEKNHCQRRTVQIRKNEKGETPLHRACISGNLKQVKRLVQQGHPVNPRDFSGWLPIHEASNYGFLAIVEYLIDNGAWINDSGGEYCGGITPLHDAAVGGHLKVMKSLIAKGASVSAVTRAGETPLICLKEWKKQMEGELDYETLNECAELETLMSTLMTEGKSDKKGSNVDCFHRNVKKPVLSSGWVTDDKPQSDSLPLETESNAAVKFDTDINEDEDMYDNPLLDLDEIVNDWGNPDVARNEYESAITNLRKKPIRKIEKRADEDVDNPLHTSDNWLVDDIKVKPKLHSGTKKRKRTLDDYVVKKKAVMESRRSPVNIVEEPVDHLKNSVSLLPCRTISVHIEDEIFAIPVPDPLLTIGWLCERAADSYCDKHGMKPKLTLLRKDRAVLSKADSLASFPDCIVTAEIDMWDEYPLIERFNQACSSLSIRMSREIEVEVNQVEKCCSANVTVGSVLNQPFLRPFLKALRLQDNLRHLKLSEVNLSGNILDAFCKSVPSLGRLVHLDLKCCSLDSTKLKQIVDAFSNVKVNFRGYQLEELDLSFNSFSCECSVLFRSLLSCFKLLRSVDLSFCDIGGLFADWELVSVIRSMMFLRELNISGNKFSKNAMKDYFCCISNLSLICLDLSNTFIETDLGKLMSDYLSLFGSSLHALRLRECNITDTDVEQISHFMQHCNQLEEIDISCNTGVSWTGLHKIITVAREHDLPLLTLKLLDLHIENEDNWESCFSLFHSGHLSKLTVSEDMLSEKEVFEQVQRLWSSLWKNRALVSRDMFGLITFSHKL